MLKGSEETADECSKTFQDNYLSESDKGEREYHDDESAKSDDVFFEDISSSLINIHKGKVNGATDSTSKQVSTISIPFGKKLICASDLNYTPYYTQRELSHDNDQNEIENLSCQRCQGSWRVVNLTNHDSVQQIKEVHCVEDESELFDFSADFDLQSNYQKQHTPTTRRVNRYSQDSRILTSTKRAQIAVSESSIISGDFRMSISTIENGNSELEDDSGSGFEEGLE